MPLAEHDAHSLTSGADWREFQFTCPSRSTTGAEYPSMAAAAVSIHVPLAEHDVEGKIPERVVQVSIHVPLAEHDVNPRTIARRLRVSIHVPLAEHDAVLRRLAERRQSFNSRAPRGARPCAGRGGA